MSDSTYKKVKEYLVQKGYHAVPDETYDHIDEWLEWYQNDVEKFHQVYCPVSFFHVHVLHDYPPFLRLTPVGNHSLYVFSTISSLYVTHGNKKRIYQKAPLF